MANLVFLVDRLDWTEPMLWLSQLADSLASRGWSITIASLREGAARQHIWRSGISLTSLGQFYIRWPRLAIWRDFLRQKQSPTLLHSCDLTSHLWSRLYPRPKGHWSFLALYLEPISQACFLQPLLRYLHRQDAYVCTPFRYIAQQLLSCGLPSQKITLIPLGFRPPVTQTRDLQSLRSSWQLPHDRRLILAFAALQEKSALKTMLWALDILRYASSDLHLAVIGPGTACEYWLQFARSLNLNSFITLVGAVQDWFPWIALADIVWLDSNVSASWYVALGALALAKPLLAFPSPILKEIIRHGETGYLVPNYDPAMLASQTLVCLESPDLISQLVYNIQTWYSKSLDLDKCIKAFEELYHIALADRSSSL